MSATTYTPAPIDTANGVLTGLTQQFKENIRELWVKERIAPGWRHGPQRGAPSSPATPWVCLLLRLPAAYVLVFTLLFLGAPR